MNALRNRLLKLLEPLLALLMTLLVLCVLWQVASRYLLRDPSTVTEELARFLLMWLSLLAGAYAYGRGAHVAIDLLPRALSPQRQKQLRRALDACVGLCALGVMVFGGGRLAGTIQSLDQTSATLGAPMGLVYLCLPVAGLLIATFALCHVHTPPSPTQPTETL